MEETFQETLRKRALIVAAIVPIGHVLGKGLSKIPSPYSKYIHSSSFAFHIVEYGQVQEAGMTEDEDGYHTSAGAGARFTGPCYF